jgi:4-hydroxy-3-methylbut-2-enyl diphosphate reductase
MKTNTININLANPRGFCAGVDRAIMIVEKALEKFGAPIYVRHEVVHNKYVIDDLKKKGAIFVEKIEEIPEGSHVIYSAHGVSKKIREESKKFNLIPIDATCPLVTKVHNEVNKMYDENYHIIMIGHQGHPEVEGTMGQIENNSPKASIHLIETFKDIDEKISYVSQTTLSVDDTKQIIDALKIKFPHIKGPSGSDICYATQNRQDAIKLMIQDHDLIIIVGSKNSSNSNRLVEIAKQNNVESFLIDNPDEIDFELLRDKKNIGISAGASAPEILIDQIITKISKTYPTQIKELKGIRENVIFKLPEF